VKVEFHPEVLKQLQRLPRDAFETALQKIIGLATEPRPHGAKKLAGGGGRDWRIRFGQYRIVYEINDDRQTLTIFTVAKRSDAYR
jgi:mRNA interferase RelE/StbE